MGEEPVGYAILDLRMKVHEDKMKVLEDKIKEVEKELKIQKEANAKGFADINDRVDMLTNSN